MLKKFKEISEKILNRKSGIWKMCEKECWNMRIRVKSLLGTFKKLDIAFGDPPKPPVFCKENPQFFGSYMAGLIDGDGNIRIKRKKYPQCAIRIISGENQAELADLIRNFLNCVVSITFHKGDRILNGRTINGKWYELEFLVSSKNYKFVKLHILPNLTINHKKEMLEEYLIKNLEYKY